MDTTLYPKETKLSGNKPFLLEFQQLKEYYNFRRKFKEDKSNVKMHGKPIQNEYYLIDRNWLNKWKECIGYQQFQSLGLEKDLTDKDYQIFMMNLNQVKKKEKLIPLDNSDIYKEDGRINPLAEFVIINKKCQEIFKKSRNNMVYNITETSVPLKFLKDKIILHITGNIKIIFFKNDVNMADEEIILIFLEDQKKSEIKDKENNDNKNKAIKESILAEIDKEDFKGWLKNRYFEMDGPDESEINEKGCKIKIINKNLKLKGKNLFQNTIKPIITLKAFKYGITKQLKEQLMTKIQEDLAQTTKGLLMPQNNTNQNNDNKVVLRGTKKGQGNNQNAFNQNGNNFMPQQNFPT